METWILATIVGAALSVMGYLLSSKDRKQGEEIVAIKTELKSDTSSLFNMCHKNKDEISAFQLRVAENHYPKHELDKRFEQLNGTISKGFEGLSQDMRDMTKTMNEHFREHHGGSQ